MYTNYTSGTERFVTDNNETSSRRNDLAVNRSFISSSDTYMFNFQDIDHYFSQLNYSNYTDFDNLQVTNCTINDNQTNYTCISRDGNESTFHNYWALLLVLFPILTLFGNVLVILSVYRERTLQSATNYFIVSLALADLLVAVVVMPFAVYVLVSFLLL